MKKLNCTNSSYVGQSKRKLNTGIKEHRNNINLDSSKHTVVTEHRVSHNHSFNWDEIKILDREINYYKKLVSEMIHIKEQKNRIDLKKDTKTF